MRDAEEGREVVKAGGPGQKDAGRVGRACASVSALQVLGWIVHIMHPRMIATCKMLRASFPRFARRAASALRGRGADRRGEDLWSALRAR
eukprot:390174-Alexandrium_andersonii.AAC.1